MISLTKSTHALKIVLAGAVTTNELRATVSYCDGENTRKRNKTLTGVTTGAVAVKLLGGGTGDARHIDFISVPNIDTVAATLKISFFEGTVETELVKEALAVGDQLLYSNEAGFYVVDANGARKTTTGTDSSSAASAANSAGLADSISRSSAGSAGLADSISRSAAVSNGLQGSVVSSAATSDGLQGSVAQSSATSGGLQGSTAQSSATSAGLADSVSRSTAVSAGTNASIARSSITSGNV